VHKLTDKLRKACYAIRISTQYVSISTLRMIYFFYFNKLMSYNIIFWGTSTHSIKIFKLQKKVIRIMTNIRSTDSCREVSEELFPIYLLLINFCIKQQ
jgi:hypothetical protein